MKAFVTARALTATRTVLPELAACMSFIRCAVAFSLCSCVGYEHIAASKSGNYTRDRIVSFGGTASQRGSDGSSFVHDHQQSFRDGAAAVGLAIGAYQAVKVNSSNNALSATQSTNAAGVTNAQTASDTAVKLGAQKPIITVPPQVITFPPK